MAWPPRIVQRMPDCLSRSGCNTADGTLEAHVEYGVGMNPRSVALGDLDGDQDADLAVANEDSGTVSILINQSVP